MQRDANLSSWFVEHDAGFAGGEPCTVRWRRAPSRRRSGPPAVGTTIPRVPPWRRAGRRSAAPRVRRWDLPPRLAARRRTAWGGGGADPCHRRRLRRRAGRPAAVAVGRPPGNGSAAGAVPARARAVRGRAPLAAGRASPPRARHQMRGPQRAPLPLTTCVAVWPPPPRFSGAPVAAAVERPPRRLPPQPAVDATPSLPLRLPRLPPEVGPPPVRRRRPRGRRRVAATALGRARPPTQRPPTQGHRRHYHCRWHWHSFDHCGGHG